MAKRARVLTTWKGNGTGVNPYRPSIMDDFSLLSSVDVTEQPAQNLEPDPNVTLVEITCSDAVFILILANPNYGDGAVLWSEDI